MRDIKPYIFPIFRTYHIVISKDFTYWHIGDSRMRSGRIAFRLELGIYNKKRTKVYGIRICEKYNGITLQFRWM